MSKFTPKFAGYVRTDARHKTAERMYPVRINIPADKAAAQNLDGVLEATALTDAAQEVTEGITNPAIARSLRVKGSAAGIAGNVVIHGLDMNDKEISETVALSGSSTVEGDKAFQAITQVDLPIQTHAAVKQVETATVAGTISQTGNVKVTITAAGLTGSPKEILVDVEDTDTASVVAGKIRDALEQDTAVTVLFDVSGAGADVVLTKKQAAANDATLNIALDNGTSAGLTPDATSTDTTAGAAPDTVSIGWGNKLGLPYRLPHSTILKTFRDNTPEGTAPTVTISKADLSSNTVKLSSAVNGTDIDIYLLV